MKFIFFLILTLFIVSCKKDKAAKVSDAGTTTTTTASPCDSINTDFTTQIQPVFMSSCAVSGCHNSTSNASGYTFETYAQISSNSSIAMATIKYVNGFSPMPKFSAKLPDSTIQKLDCWIDKGMPQ